MSGEVETRELLGELAGNQQVRERIRDRILDFVARCVAGHDPDAEQAMVAAQYLGNYYTCVETAFLRICRFFENNLPSQSWHRTLIEKMETEVPGIRPAVISSETRRLLIELLKFRHFTRYYFELDYDWDKLRYLLAKFSEVHPRVDSDLDAFRRFLENSLGTPDTVESA